MAAKKKIRLKGKWLASRLTGISCPIAGVSWKPPADERGMAQGLITFLEDRRVLFTPYSMEVGPYVVESVLDIRKRITCDLEKVSKSSTLGESLVSMRAACRKFLNETQQQETRSYRMDFFLIDCLAVLRTTFGMHITRLACAYDLELEEHLESVLPAEAEGSDINYVNPKKRQKTKKIGRA